MNLQRIFRAGFVRRWHTNPDLAHTCDRIDGHSARVARIILALHPAPTVELLRAVLIHDDGESVVGDCPAPKKDLDANLAKALSDAEYLASVDLWGHWQQSLGPEELAWLRFADRLDAYMWANHHAPHAMGADGWPEASVWLLAEADRLGVSDHLDGVLA